MISKSDLVSHIMHVGGKPFGDRAFTSLFWRLLQSRSRRKVSLVDQLQQFLQCSSTTASLPDFQLIFITNPLISVLMVIPVKFTIAVSSNERNAFLHLRFWTIRRKATDFWFLTFDFSPSLAAGNKFLWTLLCNFYKWLRYIVKMNKTFIQF